MKSGVLVLALVAASLTAVGCGPDADPPEETTIVQQPPAVEPPPAAEGDKWATVSESDLVEGKEGLKYAILEPGNGAAAKSGDNVSMHYTGWLTDGTQFDSSRTTGSPFRFTLGQRQVIAGWDYGVEGMKIGEKRQLRIPAKLGYGDSGTPGGPIPPGADLIFDVELLEIEGKS